MALCERIPVNSRWPDLAAVRRGAEAILQGRVIAAPTDTLYGLLADARNPRALREIFRVKGRSKAKPILLLVDSVAMVKRLAADIPAPFAVLADAFWPGPLTMVLRASEHVSRIVTADMGTVAVRFPKSPLVTALSRHAKRPLTGTSANLSGRLGARSADEVCAQLGARLPLVLDAGRAARSVPSTVLDLASGAPRVLRAGVVTRAQIERALQDLR